MCPRRVSRIHSLCSMLVPRIQWLSNKGKVISLLIFSRDIPICFQGAILTISRHPRVRSVHAQLLTSSWGVLVAVTPEIMVARGTANKRLRFISLPPLHDVKLGLAEGYLDVVFLYDLEIHFIQNPLPDSYGFFHQS